MATVIVSQHKLRVVNRTGHTLFIHQNVFPSVGLEPASAVNTERVRPHHESLDVSTPAGSRCTAVGSLASSVRAL